MKQKAVDGDKVRFGVIGGGNADYERAELVAVCDVLEEKLAPFREQGVAVYRDYHEMLDKTPMDLVIVRTPTHLHVPMATAALERGIHVYGEKPMAVTAQQLKGFLKVWRRSGRPTVAYATRRSMGSGKDRSTRRLWPICSFRRSGRRTATSSSAGTATRRSRTSRRRS